MWYSTQLQGTSKHLRALTIFAMPMVMPSMAYASRRQSGEQAVGPRVGADGMYSRVSRLLSVDPPLESPQPLFEPAQPATHLAGACHHPNSYKLRYHVSRSKVLLVVGL